MNILDFFSSFYIDLPYHPEGWIGWFVLLGFLLWGIKATWEPIFHLKRTQWLLLVIFTLLTPLTALVLHTEIPLKDIFPLPGVPLEPSSPVLIPLLVLPWVLAAGFLPSFWVAILGALSGLIVALSQTHHLYSLLEFSGLALGLALLFRQRYRTLIFQTWRHPLAAGITLAVFYAPLFILTSFLSTSGSAVARIDYALTQSWPLMLVRGTEVVLACLPAEILYLLHVRGWGQEGLLIPSPTENSLQRRFFATTIPLVMILVITLTIGDWVVAGNTARQMIRERLENVADIVAVSLPHFMESGQVLIQNLASPDLLSTKTDKLPDLLNQRMRAFPFFSQIYLFNEKGEVLGGYPKEEVIRLRLSEDERTGLTLALMGAPAQTYIIQPQLNEKQVLFAFIAAVKDEAGQPKAVLVGRSDMSVNPQTLPAIKAIESLSALQGEGAILDENQTIIYHSKAVGLMERYDGSLPLNKGFFEDISKTGIRRLSYFQTMLGKPWGVLVQVPAEQAQSRALAIAIPLLVILVFLSLVAFLAMRVGLRRITNSLKSLSNEAKLITQGKLDQPLQVASVDEVGQVGWAFEQMRVSLKARLEELNDLLKVSQSVATNLEAGDAIRPILEAAMGTGATSARVILPPEVAKDLQFERPVVLGFGPMTERYAYLDNQIYELLQYQNLLTIPNTHRIRRLNYPVGAAKPGAVVALALHHENRYYGALWVAYQRSHNFSEAEIRFLGTLANQAALAASNARLYASAEIGRQRLEAVLVSTPEPVLVIDEKMRLLLLNPAATQVPGLIANPIPGTPIHEVINQHQLLELITRRREDQPSSLEITLPNERVYFASVSMVTASNHLVGKVCVLQDITHYKHLDTLKSDFVETVSHDLRSPLTLIRGYTTMLQVVGELNEQQKGYAGKILTGVDSMTHLINNLLDLGRIDAGIGLQIARLVAQDVIQQVVTTLQPQAMQKNIHLTAEINLSQPVQLDADRLLLQQALNNLIENGIKYTPLGGEVKVRLITRADTVVFEVHDTGIGVAPLDLPRLFEKFYRSGRREAYQLRGAGLGLAIVKSIASRHKGEVKVESQLGKGSVFSIELPYNQSQST